MPFPPTPSITPSNTPTPSITATNTPTNSPSATSCPSLSPTTTSTVPITPTITATMTMTQTNTPTNTQTMTQTPTASATPGLSPSQTQTPSFTPTQTITQTTTQSPTPTTCLDFDVSYICNEASPDATVYVSGFTCGSGQYDINQVLYLTQSGATSGIYIQVLSPVVSYFTVENNTWWVCVKDRNNPSNIRCKSVTTNC